MLAWYPGDNFRHVIPAWFAQQNYFPLPGCLDRCSLYLYHAEVELLRKKNRHNNVVRSTNPWVKIGAKTGLDKRALSLSRTSRFPFWENNISFSLARPIIKLATLGQGKQNWEQGKAGIHVFFANPEKSVFITHNSIPWSDFEQSVFRLDHWADRGTMRGLFKTLSSLNQTWNKSTIYFPSLVSCRSMLVSGNKLGSSSSSSSWSFASWTAEPVWFSLSPSSLRTDSSSSPSTSYKKSC